MHSRQRAGGGPSHGHRQHAKKLVRIARVIPEISPRTDRHTDRHTYHNTSQPLPRAAREVTILIVWSLSSDVRLTEYSGLTFFDVCTSLAYLYLTFIFLHPLHFCIQSSLCVNKETKSTKAIGKLSESMNSRWNECDIEPCVTAETFISISDTIMAVRLKTRS